MNTRLIVALVLLTLVAIFSVQNSATVEIRLLFWQVEMPRSLLIFLMLTAGVVVGWFGRSAYVLSRNTE